MKQISQEEFEQYIQDIIDGKMTRKRLASELETVMRTINHRIMELEGKNPALYQAFIQKFPYTPKEIKLDVEALAIKVINNGIEGKNVFDLDNYNGVEILMSGRGFNGGGAVCGKLGC